MNIPSENVSPTVDVERLLLAVETQVAHIVQQVRRGVAFLMGADNPEADHLAGQPAVSVSIEEIERHVNAWQPFLSSVLEERADFAYLLGHKYRFSRDAIPNIRKALGLDDPALAVTYEQRHGQPLLEIYHHRDGYPISPSSQSVWGDATQNDIAAQLRWVQLPKGEVLMVQGAPADSMYVLLHGRLAVSVTTAGGPARLVAELGPGATVGEMALLIGGTRSATVSAVRDCELIQLPKVGFDRLVEHHPHALLHITRVLAGHVLDSNQREEPGVRLSTITVIPVGHSAATAAFCRSLTASLASYGSVLHVTHDLVSDIWGDDFDAGNNAVIAWLNNQETRYRYVVYEADPTLTLWSRRCIRQADRLLIVAPFGSGTPDPALSREVVGVEGIERDMVLLHPADAQRPQGTRRYLQEWGVHRHYHVRADVPNDLGRVVRSLLGRGVGLVLGGGGARGLAHIGVLRALREAGIPVDYVAGSSSGALVAAQYALSGDPDGILHLAREILAKPLLDFTLPLVSIVTARRFVAMLEELFDDIQIEDLWLSFFCVSSNLALADIVVHRDGSLRRAVRASCALPGVLPPIVENGQLLVDGMILNNLPVDIMEATTGGGPVIAVDVSMQFDVANNYQFGESLSAFQVLSSRFNPFAESRLVVPGIVSVILRSTELHHVYTQNALSERASLYMHPPVDAFGTLDVKPFEELIRLGYEDARDRIAAWNMLDTVRAAASGIAG